MVCLHVHEWKCHHYVRLLNLNWAQSSRKSEAEEKQHFALHIYGGGFHLADPQTAKVTSSDYHSHPSSDIHEKRKQKKSCESRHSSKQMTFDMLLIHHLSSAKWHDSSDAFDRFVSKQCKLVNWKLLTDGIKSLEIDVASRVALRFLAIFHNRKKTISRRWIYLQRRT